MRTYPSLEHSLYSCGQVGVGVASVLSYFKDTGTINKLSYHILDIMSIIFVYPHVPIPVIEYNVLRPLNGSHSSGFNKQVTFTYRED